MTGNGDGEMIRRAGARDGAHRVRQSYAPGDLGVGNPLTYGDLLKRLPYTLLEGSAAYIQRKVQARSGHLDEADNSRDQRLVLGIRANQMRFWKAVLKIAD